jgi:glycerol uptake facilitator-like aquaporin
MDDKNARVYLVEMLGTFAFVLISAGAVCATHLGGLQPWSISIALATGFTYAGALAFTLPISGGYLNPCITFMLWVFKRLDGRKAVALILCQIVGAAVAGLLLRIVLPGREDIMNVTRLGTPHLNLTTFGQSITPTVLLKGIAIELLLTFIVVLAMFALVLDPRSPRWGSRLVGLWLGLILAAETMVAHGITGAAVNTARWIGPALAELTVPSLAGQSPFSDSAPYWIGTTAGALLAAWAYTALILPPAAPQDSTGHSQPHGSTAVSKIGGARK